MIGILKEKKDFFILLLYIAVFYRNLNIKNILIQYESFIFMIKNLLSLNVLDKVYIKKVIQFFGILNVTFFVLI